MVRNWRGLKLRRILWWLKMKVEEIAKVIGHHFWNCKTDSIAITCGMDCAKEIEELLK